MALNKRASVPSDAVTGNPNPPKFTGGKGSLKPRVTVSKDKLLGKVATGVSGAAGLTAGLKVGQKVAKGGSSTPPPNENKAIPNTEKKKVDPKKNTVIKSKTTKTEKEKSDENRAKVKANTEKYLNKTKDKIKKYGTSGSHLSPLEQEMAN